jgi:tyrosyl-tRNA synthetase
MGKTEKGTIWLDPNLTSPYEYYQYWINTDDADVDRFLKLFTFLPLEEISAVKNLSDARLNMVKAVLAYEATKVTHGAEAAEAAWRASTEAFHSKPVDADLFPSSTIPRIALARDTSAMPSMEIAAAELTDGVSAFELFHRCGLCSSRGEARRLLSQGGGYINERQIENFEEKISIKDVTDNKQMLVRKGKKTYLLIKVK